MKEPDAFDDKEIQFRKLDRFALVAGVPIERAKSRNLAFVNRFEDLFLESLSIESWPILSSAIPIDKPELVDRHDLRIWQHLSNLIGKSTLP